AQAFTQQATAAGVTVNLTTESPDTYLTLTNVRNLETTPFQAFYDVNRPAAVHLALIDGKGAPFNFTGEGASYYQALAAAMATVDDKTRANRFLEIEHDFYDNGGDIVWGFAEQLDASRPGVSGVTWSQSTPLFHRVTMS
ncbi:MAG: hypothetical protein WA777_18155, partial [Rhodanobacter sp.]